MGEPMKDKKRRQSLKTRIVVTTLLPVLASFLCLSMVIYFSLSGALHDTAESKFLQLSEKYAHSFEAQIAGAMDYLVITASELETQIAQGHVDREALQTAIFNVFETYGRLDGSSVYFEPDCYDGLDARYRGTRYGTETSGRICWYYYKDAGRTAFLPEGMEGDIEFTLPHYTEAKNQNRAIYTDPVTYEIEGRHIPMFTLTYPVRNPRGDFIGAVTVDLFLDDIYTQIQNEAIYDTGYVVIENDNSRILYSPLYEHIGQTRQEAGIDYHLPRQSDEALFLTGSSMLNDQSSMITVQRLYVPQLDSAFYVSVTAPDSEIHAVAYRFMTVFALLGSGLLSGIAVLLYYLIGKLTSPLIDVSESVNRIAAGDYDARITGEYSGELDLVKSSVNLMADSIQAYIREADSAHDSLGRRLGQQALMAAISQSFLQGQDIDQQITEALRMTGEFMDVAQILFYQAEADDITLTCRNQWMSPELALPSRLGQCLQLNDKLRHLIFNMSAGSTEGYLSSNDPAVRAVMAPYRLHFQHYITIPLFIKGKLYGVLDFARTDETASMSESDIDLAKLVSSLLTGGLDRHLLETQLLRLSSIVESSPQFILYLSDNGQIDYVNPAAEAITGYAEAEIMQGGLETLFDAPTVRNLRVRHIPAILETGECSFEIPLIRKDGDKRIMAFSGFTTGAGHAKVGCIASDVTEMRQLEGELIAAKDLAEQGSRAKSDFLSRMSHEMRTPMNAIIGMTTIAQGSDDPAKKEYCLSQIDNASRHLLGVINDILDMSKIEADKFTLSEDHFAFEQMLQNVLDVCSFRVDERAQRLSVFVDPALPARLQGDEQRLSQVITNLLSNAIKFTDEGGAIELRADLEARRGGTCLVRIAVEDSGIGISDEQQDKLFRSFEQADGSIARRFGGTGLGLAISKRIVGLMGGTIAVQSTLGHGSTFTITVPLRAGEDAVLAAQLEAIRGADLEAILAGGDGRYAEHFLGLMSALNISCARTDGPHEALELLDSGRAAHLVFLHWDTDAPRSLGLARALSTRAGAPAVIALISSAHWNDIRDAALAAGVRGFIPTPTLPTALVQGIARLREGGPGASASAENIREAVSFRGKIALLAEDVAINREIIISVLEETELAVECAENGLEATLMFARDPGRYDIIFMDMHMPEVDGLEATRRIRALDAPESRTVPIVAMTANVFREDIRQCLEAGMDDHVGKPVDFDILFAKLEKYLG